jgi:hypothetical protein
MSVTFRHILTKIFVYEETRYLSRYSESAAGRMVRGSTAGSSKTLLQNVQSDRAEPAATHSMGTHVPSRR